MPLDFGRSVCPESAVASKELSHPRWEDGPELVFAVRSLRANHSGHIIGLLEVVPTGWEESWGDPAKHSGDDVEDHEDDKSGNDTVGDVV